MKRLGWFVTKRVSLWLWSGQWCLYSRNGWSDRRFDLKQCKCHHFCLFVGPFGVEVRHRQVGP